jgi:transposase
VHRLAATIEAWWPAIEAAITTGHSNARSEGYNRLAKHQGRNAFGFRNVDNHRRRIRWARTRQHRRASASTTQLPGQIRRAGNGSLYGIVFPLAALGVALMRDSRIRLA